MTPDVLFESLWQDYIQRLCPSAAKVHQLLQEDEPLINDCLLYTSDAADE